MSAPNPTALAGLLAEELDQAVDESEGWTIQASAKGPVVRLVVEDEGTGHEFRAVIVEDELVPVVAPRPDVANPEDLSGPDVLDRYETGWFADASAGGWHVVFGGTKRISFSEARRCGAALIALADAHEAAAQKAGGEGR